MRSMEAGLTEEHVEQVRALDSSFAAALGLAGDDEILQTRIPAAQLHAEFAALCLESEVAELVLQDKDETVAIEHSIVEFVEQHAEFLLSNGFARGEWDTNLLKGYGVHRRMVQLGVAE